MASDETPGGGRGLISPAKRKRLQQCFAHASKQAAQDNFDYATELFTQCVLGDLNNRVYWQSFLGNLYRKYGGKKKGARLASLRTSRDRAGLKKSQLQKDPEGVIRHGAEILKLNPWDASALMAMAAAGEDLDLDEVPLVFLNSARQAAPRDVELNRASAKALRRRRQYDQAIFCWQLVLEAKPGDQEAMHETAELTVEKTIDLGGYEDAQSSRDVATEKRSPEEQAQPKEAATAQQLERAIQKDPSDMAPYLELAEHHFREEDYGKAEEVLARAYEASGHDEDMREKLEDAQLRNLRRQLRDLESAVKAGQDEAKQAWKAIRKQIDQKFLEAAQHRCRRYPNNLNYRFDLGEACRAVGQYSEAIGHYQQARNDPRRKGICLLRLGQCFERIHQHALAATNLEAAIAEISDQDAANKKDALYSAGRLALQMKDLSKAKAHLMTVAGMDFVYKDVAALLDKLAELEHTS